jgi:phosphoserine phosphatase RsbU/P
VATLDRVTTPVTALAQADAVLAPARLAAARASGLLDTGPDEPFDRLARLASTLLGTPFAFITIVDDTRSFWKSCIGIDAVDLASRQNTVEESFCRYVVEARAEVIVDDAAVDPRTRDNPSVEKMGVRAWAGFPLLAPGGEVLGSFCVVDVEPRVWTDRDREVLSVLAHAASGEVTLRAQAEDARLLAATLQASLLPAFLPDVPGLDVAAFHHAGGTGTEVVGDFYDLFQRGEGLWNAVVGDVCGKGVAAATVTALARYTVRASAMTTDAPSGVLRALNRALTEQQPEGGTFLTAVLVRLALTPGGVRATLCSGGHCTALVRRADATVIPVGAIGTLLGAFEEIKLHDVDVQLEPGDALVLYTDGITEAPAAEGRERFGEARLRAVLGELSASAEELATRIDAAVAAFSGTARADDMAAIVLRVPPLGVPTA